MTHHRLTAFILIVLGADAMLLQITALREFMAVFSGSELDLGITLSFWLLAVGAGSMLAKNVRQPQALGYAVLLGGLCAQPLLSLVPLVRPMLALETGETVTLGLALVVTAALLTPVCVPIGMQFPLAVRTLAGNAPRAYLFEALGALLGGALFTFLIAGRLNALTVLTAVGITSVLLTAALLRKAGIALLIAVPLLAWHLLPGLQSASPDEDPLLISRTDSRYGVVEVFLTQGQRNVFAGGKFQYAYPDAQTDELRAHLAAALHPRPRQVLVAGGSPGVSLELLKYPGTAVDHIELDPVLVKVSRSLVLSGRGREPSGPLPAFLADDARRYIKALDGPRYDLIVLNLPEPATANLNRMYTVDFYREAQRALRSGGVLTLTLPASFAYVGKGMQAVHGAVYASLRAVFPHVALSSEEYGLFAASERPLETEPDALRERLQERGIALGHFHPGVFDDAFDGMKVAQYRDRLAAAAELNTDRRPIAYLYDLLLRADMQHSTTIRLLADHGVAFGAAVLAVLIATGAMSARRRQAAPFTVFLSGYTSLSFCLVILLAYQCAFGYVYERVGLLTAAFMAGSAAGASLVRDAGRPLAVLRYAEAALAVLFLLAPALFRQEILFVAMIMLAGMAGGAVFVAANRGAGVEAPAEAAGTLYALDLAGSFLGALLTALFLVPLFGILATLYGLVALKLLSLAVLGSVRDEKV